MQNTSVHNRIKEAIRDIKDYPKPGIVFKDISPLLASPDLVDEVVRTQIIHWKDTKIDAIAAIEARGFIFGSVLAHTMKVPFIPVRKLGKLPYTTMTEEYTLEYGTASIEMHTDAIQKGWRILIHDDLLATGGTAAAAGRLIHKLGGTIAGFSFIINLGFLPGEKNLREKFNVDPFYLINY